MSYMAHTMETSKFVLHVKFVSEFGEFVSIIRRMSDNAKMYEEWFEAVDDAVFEGEKTLLSFEYNRGGW